MKKMIEKAMKNLKMDEITKLNQILESIHAHLEKQLEEQRRIRIMLEKHTNMSRKVVDFELKDLQQKDEKL